MLTHSLSVTTEWFWDRYHQCSPSSIYLMQLVGIQLTNAKVKVTKVLGAGVEATTIYLICYFVDARLYLLRSVSILTRQSKGFSYSLAFATTIFHCIGQFVSVAQKQKQFLNWFKMAAAFSLPLQHVSLFLFTWLRLRLQDVDEPFHVVSSSQRWGQATINEIFFLDDSPTWIIRWSVAKVYWSWLQTWYCERTIIIVME